VHYFLHLRSRAAGLFLVAVLGGGVALGGAAALGKLGERTTVIRQEAVPSSSAPVAFAQGKRMSINEIYRASAPGVVHIETTSRVQQPTDFFGNPFGGSQTQRALGSGFVIDKTGHIVTNYHVVQGARTIQVSFSDNERFKATVVGVDPSTDTAVLQVHVKSRALKSLPLGNSDAVRVGDQVIAIGNPFGLDRSVTAGIVSAVQRTISAPNQLSISHVIQTDAALNHGNSGGPLLNADGKVIGVNAQIAPSSSGANIGIGFAIPINTVRNAAADLIRHGKVEHSFLGIEAKAIQPQIAKILHLPVQHGLMVARVIAGSGADKAGLVAGKTPVIVAGESWPAGGDIIVKADGHPVATIERLRDLVSAKKPGDSVTLDIYRSTTKLTVQVKLGRQPATPP